MAELYTIKQETLTEIANAVRAKKGTTAAIAVSNLADEISSISSGGGGSLNLQEKTVTFDEDYGTDTVTPDDGYDGLSKVIINSKWNTSEKLISSYSYSGTSRGSFFLSAAERNALLNGCGKISFLGYGSYWQGDWVMTYYGPVTDPDAYEFNISMSNITHLVIFTNVSEHAIDFNFTLYFGVLSNGRCVYIGGEDAYNSVYTNADIDAEEFFVRGDTVTVEYYT